MQKCKNATETRNTNSKHRDVTEVEGVRFWVGMWWYQRCRKNSEWILAMQKEGERRKENVVSHEHLMSCQFKGHQQTAGMCNAG